MPRADRIRDRSALEDLQKTLHGRRWMGVSIGQTLNLDAAPSVDRKFAGATTVPIEVRPTVEETPSYAV